MNLTPYSIDERYNIYQIEKIDYITANLANVQPQSILNTLTYIKDNIDIAVSNYSSYISDIISSISDILDASDSAIDELENQTDVVDIVSSYNDLLDYNTSHLYNGDIIKVLADANYDNAPSFYEWNGSSFIFKSYEIDFPHIIVAVSSVLTPTVDTTYIISTSDINITLSSIDVPDGTSIHLVPSGITKCTVVYNNTSIPLYNNMDIEFVFYNGTWYTSNDNTRYEQHMNGDIVLSSSDSCPFSYGTWELLEEGCALVTGNNDTMPVTGNAVGSNSITFSPSYTATSGSTTITVAMLPNHRHIIYVSAASASHTHLYSLHTVSCKGSKSTVIYGVNKTKSVTSSSVDSGSHQHTITAYMGLSTVYSSSPTGHTHSITVNDITISTMQSSIAYYAWKRTA